MNIVSFNCHGFKANHLMVEKLISNFDICFFSEHWLGDAEGYLFNQLCRNQSTIFSSDFSNHSHDSKIVVTLGVHDVAIFGI